jgi:hypothetical protein
MINFSCIMLQVARISIINATSRAVSTYRIPNVIKSSFNHWRGCLSLLISFVVKWCRMSVVARGDVSELGLEIGGAAVIVGGMALKIGVPVAGCDATSVGTAIASEVKPPRLIMKISFLIRVRTSLSSSTGSLVIIHLVWICLAAYNNLHDAVRAPR